MMRRGGTGVAGCRRLAMARLLAGLCVLAGALSVVASRGTAHANGVPQLVKLSYVASLSTWGPEEAEGVLEFSFADGYLRLDAEGLPRLVGQAYEGWLVRSSTNEAISVGQFNASSAGSAHYEAQLPPITDYSLDLFVVTVQSLTEPTAEPSAERSIAGFFAVVQPTDAGGSRGETAAAKDAGQTGTGSPPRGTGLTDSGPTGAPPVSGPAAADANGETPATLPATGDTEQFFGDLRGIALILVGGLALAWAAARTRRRVRNGGSP